MCPRGDGHRCGARTNELGPLPLSGDGADLWARERERNQRCARPQGIGAVSVGCCISRSFSASRSPLLAGKNEFRIPGLKGSPPPRAGGTWGVSLPPPNLGQNLPLASFI
ncbi:adenosylmethionine-8-amino-7-oxononanoate aminotransferase [Platysternon megacephalum]|uniref:Adenosylmethionine-8-amino-7-oxononanoate aminotransferase n=1 Tax=Platysternon megacephalum TaxID=55544 RepID=A0A4D9DHC3_9SAUR|nr:adenosylmethionine-8-amino-7-oxononanoate aminotransferase [Platysternon megacephalum]